MAWALRGIDLPHWVAVHGVDDVAPGIYRWPDLGTAGFNLFCCRPRPHWPWDEKLRASLLAQRIAVRVVERKGAGA